MVKWDQSPIAITPILCTYFFFDLIKITNLTPTLLTWVINVTWNFRVEKKKRSDQKNKALYGGFHLVDLIITELKDHMICYKLVENLFVKKNYLQVLPSSVNAVISTNERAWILKGHVTFKLLYTKWKSPTVRVPL